MGKTIGVFSIKGGVGKTSAVVALGDALAGFGKKVLLVDANFSAPNLGAHLNMIEPSITIHEVLGRANRISEAIQKHENFDVLPAKIFNKMKIAHLDLKKKLGPLKRTYDFIIIDSSPALNDESLAVMFASDELILVATPDIPTLTSTLKTARLVSERNIPVNGLILNKTHEKDFELSIGDIEGVIDLPVLAVIPYDLDILKAVSNFVPPTTFRPNSKATVEYKKLAGVLSGNKYKPFSIKDFFSITPKRQEINRELFYERVFK